MFFFFFFFFNDTATTEIYTLSLHDALPIWFTKTERSSGFRSYLIFVILHITFAMFSNYFLGDTNALSGIRSEEHTSELQSRQYLVCRLLLEKKKKDKEEYTVKCINYIY